VRPSQLTGLEIASGLVLGAAPRRRTPGRPGSPREELERSLVKPLRKPPCLVSFSGGRDSSAVLAVATHVARREGLPLPVPATLRFPAAEGTAESEWQELVVAHLRLSDWIRLDVTGELDCVGPVASASLERHGLLWPCNAHFHIPVLGRARGGSVLTGIGGDEMFGHSRWSHARDAIQGRAPRRPRDILAVGLAVAPSALRRPLLRKRTQAPFPWLHPSAVEAVEHTLAADEASEPFRWGPGIEWRSRRRYLQVGTESLAVLARHSDTELSHPLLDPAFVAALARQPRSARFSNRQQAMADLFRDVLPADVIARRSKAQFDGAFWHEPSRELAARWNGEGVDANLVDVERLHTEWRSDAPDPRTFTLLQSVKLALDLAPGRSAHGGEESQARVVEPVPTTRPADLPRG
jgi:asparagine synthetase B (glutamine-hydrolysing)